MIRLPDSAGNRTGCFVILYLFVSLNAGPGNNVPEDIQTLPAR